MVKSLMIDAPREKVWSALTETEHMRAWFSGADCEISELAPGGALTLRFAGGADVCGRILEVEKPEVFAYEIGDGPGDRHYMRIRFTLTAEQAGRTRLRLEESDSHQDRIKAVAEAL